MSKSKDSSSKSLVSSNGTSASNSNYTSESEDLGASYWMPLNLSQLSKSKQAEALERPDVCRLELPQISQKNLLHRKADIDDFKACMDSPTVLPAFLELYVKFQ